MNSEPGPRLCSRVFWAFWSWRQALCHNHFNTPSSMACHLYARHLCTPQGKTDNGRLSEEALGPQVERLLWCSTTMEQSSSPQGEMLCPGRWSQVCSILDEEKQIMRWAVGKGLLICRRKRLKCPSPWRTKFLLLVNHSWGKCKTSKMQAILI